MHILLLWHRHSLQVKERETEAITYYRQGFQKYLSESGAEVPGK